jgi:nitrate/TMAO reductase-like tetraheme cytochrome c subunit
MSLGVRVGIVVVLLAGATLFVLSLASPASDGPDREPERPAANGTRTWPAAKPGVLDAPENCRTCHEQIYEEWERDRHSQAWVGELYTRLSMNHEDSSCWACHAPRPVLETGLDSPAETRANYRESGINCLSCHKRDEHVVGPNPEPKGNDVVGADCGPMFDAAYPTDRADLQEAVIAMCGVCHNLHKTHEEFRGSKYYREGKTCLSCHMTETTDTPSVKGGEKRTRKVHRFPGAHSKAMLERAAALRVQRAGDRLEIRVINEGAGHRLPTDARHRAVRVRVAFFDERGQPVPVASPETGELEREVTTDLIRLFYRLEQKDPTQIDPAGTLGKDNWRDCSIEIPAAARKGKARVRVVYNLYVNDPVDSGTVMQEATVDLG